MKQLMREYEDLCTLGLPGREVVPLAIALLARMVGGGLTCFVWADARCEAENSYILEDIPEACPRIYAEAFYNRREAEVGPTFTRMLRDRIPLVNFARIGSRMSRSAMHAELFDAFGLGHFTRTSVIDGERRYGMLATARVRGDPIHSERDEQTLLRAARHLAFAFELERAGRLVHGESIDSGDTGFLLLDASGKLLHGCDRGLHLFYEATRTDGLAHRPAGIRKTLPATLAARASGTQPSEELVVNNRRGEFIFRPFAMRSTSTGGDAPVAVTVRRRESMATRLWQGCAGYGLSGRERQVAVLVGLGRSHEDIAGHIAVSRNTAVSYVRRTYEKLGVRQREQLIRQLLSAKTPAQSPAGP